MDVQVKENAVIIHGTCDESEYFDPKFPSLSNSHWLPWLQKQLLIRKIPTQTPEMPNAYLPDYKAWSTELGKQTLAKDTIAIGHSCGAGFLLRYLSENKINIAKLVLVAPWLDPEKEKDPKFFDFEIDEYIHKQIGEIHLIYSENDMQSVLESVATIQSKIKNIQIKKFKLHGHFTYGEMRTTKFPELLEICTNLKPVTIESETTSLFQSALNSILNFLKTNQ